MATSITLTFRTASHLATKDQHNINTMAATRLPFGLSPSLPDTEAPVKATFKTADTLQVGVAQQPKSPAWWEVAETPPVVKPPVRWEKKISSWLEPNPTRRGLVEWRDGIFLHFCPACGRWGSIGIDVDLLRGRLGRWYCQEHRPT